MVDAHHHSLSLWQVVLFLDYDGTLSPIADQPDEAFMNEGMRPVLAQVRLGVTREWGWASCCHTYCLRCLCCCHRSIDQSM